MFFVDARERTEAVKLDAAHVARAVAEELPVVAQDEINRRQARADPRPAAGWRQAGTAASPPAGGPTPPNARHDSRATTRGTSQDFRAPSRTRAVPRGSAPRPRSGTGSPASRRQRRDSAARAA